MRLFLIIASLILTGQQLNAQDTLVKRSGDKLVVKLLEINPNNILYKRFDDPDGPVFSVLKQDIGKIIYSNGEHEVLQNAPQVEKEQLHYSELSIHANGRVFYYENEKIKETEMVSIVYKLSNKSLNAMGKKIERLRIAQNIGTFCTATCFIYGFYTFQTNGVKPVWIPGNRPQLSGGDVKVQNLGNALMLAGIVSAAVTVKCMFERRKHNRLIVDAYNKHIAR